MRKITPSHVHGTLRRHVLLAGGELVPDLAKSRDSYIVDARDGSRYLDFHGLFGSIPLGFNHPRLNEGAFINKLGRMAVHKPSSAELATIEMAEFVDAFSRVGIPETLPHLFVIEGESLAVESALKTAFDWKVRKNLAKGLPESTGNRVVHFRHAHHGCSGYTLSLTNTAAPLQTQYYPVFDWPRVASPFARFPLEGANLRDTEDREIQAVADLRSILRERRDEIAAVIIEPIQCEGGDNHFRSEFFRELRRACDEFEALLILDETRTGVGITGKFWCHEHHEVTPDVVIFGSHLPVPGILVGPRIEEVEGHVFSEPARLRSAWGGHLVDMARAARILEIVEADKLVENAAEQGEGLLSGLKRIAEKEERITNLRGRGLLVAFDLPTGDARDTFLAKAKAEGLLALSAGHRTVRFRPALSVSKKEIEHGLDVIYETLHGLS